MTQTPTKKGLNKMKKLTYHNYFHVAYWINEKETSMRVAATSANQAGSLVYQLEPNAHIISINQEIKTK